MSHRIISTILRHDSKQTSYKIALLRALNDVVLAYPDVGRDGRDVAVPLRSWGTYLGRLLERDRMPARRRRVAGYPMVLRCRGRRLTRS